VNVAEIENIAKEGRVREVQPNVPIKRRCDRSVGRIDHGNGFRTGVGPSPGEVGILKKRLIKVKPEVRTNASSGHVISLISLVLVMARSKVKNEVTSWYW